MVKRKGKVILVDDVEDLFGGVKNIAKVNLLVADDSVVDMDPRAAVVKVVNGGSWFMEVVCKGNNDG